MKKFFILLFLLVIPLIFAPKIFAEEINSFDVSVTAHQNGLMDISEKINYVFDNGPKHGIYRYIPLFSKVGNLYRIVKIENVAVFRDGAKEQFNQSSDSKTLNLKIGNPNQTISGAHNYEIDYTVENGIGSNFADHDEIYWNATGNGWEVDIDNASLRISNDFGAKSVKVLCYTGPLGSQSSDCSISGDTIKTNQTLYPEEGLTGVVNYPVGTFPKSILSTNPPQSFGEQIAALIFGNILVIYLLINIILPIILFVWYKMHKNKDKFGKPVVNFDVPKDESGDRIAPALAGTIDNGGFNRNDVTATIFDLAIRKYIKLVGSKTVRKLLPDEMDQKITKLKDPDGLNTFETTLYERLFEMGDTVDVKDLSLDFYATYGVLEDEVFDSLEKDGYFVKNPKTEKGLLIVGGIFALFTLNIVLAVALFYLSGKMNGRTVKGDTLNFQIDGLKLFLKQMDRNYNWQAQKFYTVEQMIPYAMALGYIDKFMEALKVLKPNYSPYWYSGYAGSFYNNYGLFYSGLSSNLTTSAPSSDSGGDGGGFSGGGGGGGGGGSW